MSFISQIPSGPSLPKSNNFFSITISRNTLHQIYVVTTSNNFFFKTTSRNTFHQFYSQNQQQFLLYQNFSQYKSCKNDVASEKNSISINLWFRRHFPIKSKDRFGTMRSTWKEKVIIFIIRLHSKVYRTFRIKNLENFHTIIVWINAVMEHKKFPYIYGCLRSLRFLQISHHMKLQTKVPLSP